MSNCSLRIVMASLALALFVSPSAYSQSKMYPGDVVTLQCVNRSFPHVLGREFGRWRNAFRAGLQEAGFSVDEIATITRFITEHQDLFDMAISHVVPPNEELRYLKSYALDLNLALPENTIWWDTVNLPKNWLGTYSENNLDAAQLQTFGEFLRQNPDIGSAFTIRPSAIGSWGP